LRVEDRRCRRRRDGASDEIKGRDEPGVAGGVRRLALAVDSGLKVSILSMLWLSIWGHERNGSSTKLNERWEGTTEVQVAGGREHQLPLVPFLPLLHQTDITLQLEIQGLIDIGQRVLASGKTISA
jgi:hypothetical protein